MSTRVRPFTHVYIFEAGPYCKVGATSNMRQRMKDMRCYAMQYVQARSAVYNEFKFDEIERLRKAGARKRTK